jgi:hypothetical protein
MFIFNPFSLLDFCVFRRQAKSLKNRTKNGVLDAISSKFDAFSRFGKIKNTKV